MAEIEDAETREAIVMKVASGASLRAAVREFMTSERAVQEVITEEARRAASGEAMRETWFLEAKRLQAAGLKCYTKGMAGAGDTNALNVYAKLVERHAVLAGANAPATHVLNVTTQTAPIEQSSTQQLRQALDRLRLQNYSPREKELEGKEQRNEPMTDDEVAELDEFRAARDRKHMAELERKVREREERRLAQARS
jgi:hypothetical protein